MNTSIKDTKKVIVGLSGGVDSSVAAYLLIEAGYHVEGLFMKNWEGDNTEEYCLAEQDLADARAICARLAIPLYTVNFSKKYFEKVFQHFLTEYQTDRTPNPDILCNKEIKFSAFLSHAQSLGAEYIATGHYARKREKSGEFFLCKSADLTKDQTYFLYTLGQMQLSRTLFPIGHLSKKQVRKIAKEQGLITHDKKDSTGICFIGERKFKQFLSEYILGQPGNIEDPLGRVLGQHDGLMFYTIGQRQGLNIGGRNDAQALPWYVVQKDIKRNVLIVAQGQDHPFLYAQGLYCEQLHWITEKLPIFPLTGTAKIRYRQFDTACLVTLESSTRAVVIFSQKQRAITPGQSIVFYQGDVCLGGAVITEAIS